MSLPPLDSPSLPAPAPGADTAQPVAAEVDARGLNCPLPILRAKKALSALPSGQLVRVLATDPGSLRDFQAYAAQTGNTLIAQSRQGELFIHVLRRR